MNKYFKKNDLKPKDSASNSLLPLSRKVSAQIQSFKSFKYDSGKSDQVFETYNTLKTKPEKEPFELTVSKINLMSEKNEDIQKTKIEHEKRIGSTQNFGTLKELELIDTTLKNNEVFMTKEIFAEEMTFLKIEDNPQKIGKDDSPRILINGIDDESKSISNNKTSPVSRRQSISKKQNLKNRFEIYLNKSNITNESFKNKNERNYLKPTSNTGSHNNSSKNSTPKNNNQENSNFISKKNSILSNNSKRRNTFNININELGGKKFGNYSNVLKLFKIESKNSNKRDSNINANTSLSPKKEDLSIKKNENFEETFLNLENHKNRMKSASDREEIEKFAYDNTISYSPKTIGLKPKYYHNFITKKIFSDKSFNDSNKKKKKNAISLTVMPVKKRKSLNKTALFNLNTPQKQNSINYQTKTEISEPYTSSYGNFLRVSLNQSKILKATNTNINKKEEICKFYIDILRRVELINFRKNMIDKSLYTLEIDDIHLLNEKDIETYESFVKILSTDYFNVLKKIYNLHIAETKRNKTLNQRKIEMFVKDFKLIEKIPKLSKELFHIICTKVLKNKYCEFKDFIEILYQILKLKNYPENFSKANKLKSFIDEFIFPVFKIENSRYSENNGQNIQIFYEKYKIYSNPTVCLFCECDDLMKHIFSLYESFDLKISEQTALSYKNFIKFCNDFHLIPNLCSTTTVSKIFKIFEEKNKGFIKYSCFVMALCSIAHIGFSAVEDKYKGFFKKIWKLFEILMNVNNNISEKLVILNLMS